MEEEKRMSTYGRKELRSPKVQKILGEMPYALEHWNMVVILVILAALAGVLVSVDYPYGNGESIIRHIWGVILRK